MNVLLVGRYTTVHAARLRRLLSTDWSIRTVDEEEYDTRLSDELRNADAMIGFVFDRSMADAPRLKLIQTPTTGYEKIRLELVPDECSVANVYGHDLGISEFVMLAMLELTIGFSKLSQSFKTGSWTGGVAAPGPTHGELFGATLGIVGYGSIGRLVASRAKAFGMRIVAVTGREPPSNDLCDWIASVDRLNRLLTESDFVLVACPLTEKTQGLIGARELDLMKSSAFLINVARGQIVDEEALYHALRDGRIAGAALDVWYNYPTADAPDAAPSAFPFNTLDNVYMTPHASVWSHGLFERRWRAIAENLDRLAEGRDLQNVVYANSTAH